MKKKTLWGLALVTVLLAGCEMPFVVTEKETLEKFVDAQAEIVQSTLEIDEQLQVSLQKTLKETEGKVFPSEQLINEVRSAKQTQQALYQQVQLQQEPYGKKHIKDLYLGVVSVHMDSYAQYEELLRKKERKSFEATLAQSQIKEDNIVAQSLILLNYELKQFKLEPREHLLPIKKEANKK